MDSHKGQEKKKRLIVLLPVCMANDYRTGSHDPLDGISEEL